MNPHELWKRFKDYYYFSPDLGFALDISRIPFPDGFLDEFEPKLQDAYTQMDELEAGAIKNVDENRMVGHYWLRAPHLAPEGVGAQIEKVLTDIESFAASVHDGTLRCERGQKFKNVLLIGIGGSALGPQFVTGALSKPGQDKLNAFFFDNTDPDGIDRTLARIGDELGVTLTIVISKSGGTKETRNGMLEAAAAYTEAGLHFGHHAVAITEPESQLDKVAQ
ncbi:glucose-6-phosphate isomerase, partial [bacterium]